MNAMDTPSAPSLLLVDDDPLVRVTLAMGLDDEGFRVVEADSGEAALALIKDGLEPSVVITDINLGPGISGVDLANHLAEVRPDLRVVLISGRWRPPSPETLADERPFLAKPFPLTALARLAKP